jgi:hypothetical protein
VHAALSDTHPNTTMSSPVDEIADLLRAQPRVSVRLAARRNDHGWQLAVLEIITGAPPPAWRAHVWRYDTAAFIAARPAGRSVARWLTSKKIRIASLTMALDAEPSASYERRDSNSQSIFQTLAWPTREWTLHLTDNPIQDAQQELVAAGMPAFINFDQAAAAHFQPPKRLNRNFSGRQAIIRHQDERARLEHVLIRPTEILATVSGTRLRGMTVTIGGYDGPRRVLAARTRKVRLPLPEGITPGAWLALHHDNELIDRRILDPNWGATGVDIEVAPETRVEALINGGECDTVEFKREIPPQPQRLMRTIAAFANGGGGTMLLGVQDDGEILGLKVKDARAAADRLTNLITDTARPLPDFRAETIKAAGRWIIALTVEPGPQPPYGVGGDNRDTRYYIRRAATTFPASPEDLRALIQAREPQPGLMFPPRTA